MSTPKSKVITVRVVGPLEPYAGEFMALLTARGYAPLTRVPHLQVMSHLSKWLTARELEVGMLTGMRVGEYLDQRRADGYASFCTRTSLAPLLDVLLAAGAPVNEPSPPPFSAVEALLDGYARFLRQERGLAASTVSAYVLRARRFLDGHGHGADLRAVDTAVVTGAVLHEADSVSAGSAQFFVVALRSFLRYCHLTGVIDTDLSAASLPVTGRRRSVLPQGITPADARALLKACDRRTAAGRRDYAVILLLMRLGLRACEVAALRLEDINWRAGEITIHGKARRVDRLPLPAEVGEAVAAYLRHAPPHDTRLREVVVRAQHRTPGRLDAHGGRMLGASGEHPRRPDPVRAAPAAAHAGLRPAPGRAGVPLHEIGQVLRRAGATSTSIYARVDVHQLSGRPARHPCP